MIAGLSPAGLIAPCGINCGICLGYLRKENKCAGCRSMIDKKPKHCFTCSITTCEHLKKTESGFCFDCTIFPCRRLKALDKRYRLNYRMSILENLEYVKTFGLEDFVLSQKEKWSCKFCGGTVCVHRGYCMTCFASV